MSTSSGLISNAGSTHISVAKTFEAKLTGVNDTATPVDIIEAQQNLFCNLLADVHGHTLVLVSLDQTKKVFPEHFKNHANMGAVGSFMPEVIKEGDNMRPAWVCERGGGGRVRI